MASKTKKPVPRKSAVRLLTPPEGFKAGHPVKPEQAVKPEQVFTADDLDKLDQLTAEIKAAQKSFIIIADDVLAIWDAGLWAARKHPDRNDPYKGLPEFLAVNFQFSASETSRYLAGGKVRASTLTVRAEKDLRDVGFVPTAGSAAHRDAELVRDLFE